MKVFQIYFRPEQESMLEPEFTPYFNRICTPYFESYVIRHLVQGDQHKGSEYFGVVSYKLRSKLGFMKDNWKNNKNIANISVNEFTVEKFKEELYKHRPDVMSFQRHSPHDTVLIAENFHPGFRKFWEEIMNEIGFPWTPTRIEDVFYCNYYVAKEDIYEAFVKEMLSPAIDYMDYMGDLWKNSNYPEQLPYHLQIEWGQKHYPFHPFICERMMSWYAHVKKLNCLHY